MRSASPAVGIGSAALLASSAGRSIAVSAAVSGIGASGDPAPAADSGARRFRLVDGFVGGGRRRSGFVACAGFRQHLLAAGRHGAEIVVGRFHGRALDLVPRPPCRPLAAAALPAAGAAVGLDVGGALLALLLGDQRLPVGDRDLIVVGMNFAEGQEAVAVAAVVDERRLQRRFDARNLGEIDVAAELFAVGRLEVEFFDSIAAQNHHPGLLRMGRIDQHLVGH